MDKRSRRLWKRRFIRITLTVVIALAIPPITGLATVLFYRLSGYQGLIEFQVMVPMLLGLLASIIVLISGTTYTIWMWDTLPKQDELKCPECGYDMRGSFADHRTLCPECGHFCRIPRDLD